MTSAPETPWLTVAQVAALTQCGRRLIYRAVRSGRLRAATIGARRDLRIHRDWIDEWLRSSSEPREVPRGR